jgi:hypothetical protein
VMFVVGVPVLFVAVPVLFVAVPEMFIAVLGVEDVSVDMVVFFAESQSDVTLNCMFICIQAKATIQIHVRGGTSAFRSFNHPTLIS